ncbi:MAG: osmotically-inducible protein OsmY [Gammaproteobacteria bacterium]
MKHLHIRVGGSRYVSWFLAILTLTSLSGCAGILVGSAATSAVVAHDERTTGTFVEDQAIELKALDAIRSNAELKENTNVSTTSYNQVVLVTGQAPTARLKAAAISAISKLEKVRHVYDEIALAAPSSIISRSGDSVLTAKVKTKLFTLRHVDATKVKVVTDNGVVYLMGILSTESSNLAAAAASEVGGVQKVVKLFEYKN